MKIVTQQEKSMGVDGYSGQRHLAHCIAVHPHLKNVNIFVTKRALGLWIPHLNPGT